MDGDGKLELVAQLSGQEIRAGGQIASIAQLMAREDEFSVKLAIEGFGLTADTDLVVSLAEDRPSATGKISVSEAILSGGGEGISSGGASESPGSKVFPATPLPWDTLATAHAHVNLTLSKVVLSNGLEISNVVVPVKLAGSKLSADPITLAVAGGTVRAALAMDAADKSVSLKADAKGFTAENVAKAIKMTDLIAEGALDLNINVRGSGGTVRAAMANLNGSVVGGMGQSRIRSDALNVIGADIIMQVASIINPLGNKDPYTVAQCAVVNFQISQGIARTERGIALVTDKMQVTSSGKIDLGAERVDLNVRPKVSAGIGVGIGNLVQAVKISGPLSDPGVGIDAAGAAKTIGTIGAAIATGGLSILAQGAKSRMDTLGGDPCQDARTWHTKSRPIATGIHGQ